MFTGMRKTVKAEITVFLSLIFLILLSLITAVIESAVIQGGKSSIHAEMSCAMESVFAEYEKDLFKQYGIFAIEGSYETGILSEENILNRLSYYGAENVEMDIESIRYITDNNGAAFFEQAVQYEKEKYGVAAVNKMMGNVSVWKEQNQKTEEHGKEDTKTSVELEQILQNNEAELPTEENVLSEVEKLKTLDILSLVLPSEFQMSQKAINLENTISRRELNKGYGSQKVKEKETGDTVFFNLYLKEYFGNALNKKENGALEYEQEYLLAGKESDRDNLKAVVQKICNYRCALNYAYLLTDSEKQLEAETAAAALALVSGVPALEPVLKQAILFAWAYAEGMVDAKTLLHGKCVPLLKTRQDWVLGIDGIFELGKNSVPEGKNQGGGYDYDKYLQMLLIIEKKDQLCIRAMELIEEHLRVEKSWFYMDHCIVGLRVNMTSHLKRNITYRFLEERQYK